MSKRCDICGKGSTKGAKRSHSNVKTLKRQNRNLQPRKVNGVKLKICTKCLRTLAKNSK
ncbi:50S ribosomal protein L28 [bacterium]|nr:50S ribosomal protein L28 [bacterium]